MYTKGVSFFSRESYGKIYAYEKGYDRINTKNERPLQILDRIKYNTTTSDDPVIQQVGLFIREPQAISDTQT
jgi:hypothetical protein